MAIVEPSSPQKGLVHPDHVPVTSSPLQSTVTTIAKDLAGLKISTDEARDGSKSGSPSNKSSDLPDIKTPTDQPNIKNKCTNCGHFDAKSFCAGCHQAPNTDGTPHVSVSYCTKECQKAHWPSHRTECKNLQARKALFRAAWLLQKIYYTVRRESYDSCVVSVEEVDGELLVHEGNYSLEPTKREDGFYRDFPDGIFENERDADACLSLLYCNDSLSHMYVVTDWLLKGICAEVEEIKVKVITPTRNTRYARDEWDQDWIHEILQARLKSGEVYAIDLTGAQYGWYEPIMEWDEYSSRCIELISITSSGIDGRRPLGSGARSVLISTFSNHWDSRTDLQRALPMCCECLKHEFNKGFIREVINKYPRGSDILKLSIRDFETVQKEITSKTKQITSDAAEKVDVLLPVIASQAHLCNKEMRKEMSPDKGAILKHGMTKLAAFFNGEWVRDGSTGRLTSGLQKRLISVLQKRLNSDQDRDFLNSYHTGSLAESKLWEDLILNQSMRGL